MGNTKNKQNKAYSKILYGKETIYKNKYALRNSTI